MTQYPESLLLVYLRKYEKAANEAKESGNNEILALNLRKAAEVLMQIAELKTGEVKEATIRRANGLVAIAETVAETAEEEKRNRPTVQPKQEARKPDPKSTGRTQPPKKPKDQPKKDDKDNSKDDGNNKQRAVDDTETIWEAVDVPDIGFDDVAGLDAVKEAVMTQFIYPRKHKEVYSKLNVSSGGGILMYGPPGTGKTLMAKAIAHEAGAKFFQVKCSDIVSKWFGESEKNVKNLFATARKEKEAVIFFDEFESIAAKRGGDGNNVMSRLVPELLAQIQGFNETENTLLLIAATNRPWDIDSAFLRPGRFNDLLYIPLPDEPARMYIVNKAFKKTPIDGEVDINKFVEYTEGFNGADVDNFCNKIKQNAAKRVIDKNLKEVVVVQDDIDKARSEIKSSVSQEDIELIKKFEKDMKRN